MSKVLIIGPNYFNFLPAVESAFRELGWGTCVCGYDTPVHPYRGLARLRYKLSHRRDYLIGKSRAAFQKQALQAFDEARPDMVFIMNGDMLETETLDRFRATAKVALWLFDSRTKLPASLGHAGHVDALFCFEQDDVAWFRSQGEQASFLPQACDTARYFPIPGARKDIDILFVGNLYYSPRRKELLNAVIDRYSDRRIEVYGWYQPWFKGLGKWLRRPHKEVYKNVNVSSEEANRLYNRAKVVLNIHQEHQRDGANPRVFEICGSGAWQVCDCNPYIASLFADGEVGLYSNEKELFVQIARGLDTDTSVQAAAACERVRSQHSFRNRMAQVLTTVYGPSEASV